MTVVGCSFLLPIHGALRVVHIQDDSLVACPRYGMVYPLSIQLPQSSQVILVNEHFSLKPAQGIGAGRLLLQGAATNHRLRSGTSSQPWCIIGVLVSHQASIY